MQRRRAEEDAVRSAEDLINALEAQAREEQQAERHSSSVLAAAVAAAAAVALPPAAAAELPGPPPLAAFTSAEPSGRSDTRHGADDVHGSGSGRHDYGDHDRHSHRSSKGSGREADVKSDREYQRMLAEVEKAERCAGGGTGSWRGDLS